jgi:hypothetical protein
MEHLFYLIFTKDLRGLALKTLIPSLTHLQKTDLRGDRAQLGAEPTAGASHIKDERNIIWRIQV